jgi:ribosome-associated heat shock protein Hsp15|tara:strand:- start:17 stop:367 length:351 start_codon:yes stop_codon:yes gene_type:complete
MRIDFYIWTVRYFESRNKATIACKNGNVSVNGIKIKPSHEVLINDTISVKRRDKVDKFIVLDFPKSRVGNKLVDLYRMKKETDFKNKLNCKVNPSRKKGEGRPTKKERRNLDEFLT